MLLDSLLRSNIIEANLFLVYDTKEIAQIHLPIFLH